MSRKDEDLDLIGPNSLFNQAEKDKARDLDEGRLLQGNRSLAATRAIDSATNDEEVLTTKDLELIQKLMASTRARVDELENIRMNSLAVPQLTPSDNLDKVKIAINQIINYINIGIRK